MFNFVGSHTRSPSAKAPYRSISRSIQKRIRPFYRWTPHTHLHILDSESRSYKSEFGVLFIYYHQDSNENVHVLLCIIYTIIYSICIILLMLFPSNPIHFLFVTFYYSADFNAMFMCLVHVHQLNFSAKN